MTTIKNPLARPSPLSCLKPVRATTPLKSSLARMRPVLPDIVSSNISGEHQSKKRVRFALKLEPVEEDSSLPPNHEPSIIPTTKPSKRIIDPWRENGPLYGAYVEYLETNNVLTPEITEITRPSTPEPNVESSTYTQTFVIQGKSPDIVIDSITVSTPENRLSRINYGAKSNKKINRKPLSPVFDPHLKQRMHTGTPPRYVQSRKIPTPVNNKNQSNIVKRADLALPPIKNINSNEKIIRADQPLGTKIVNEYLQSKKLTEIITNPLPGTNNQINYLSGHTILPHIPKITQIYCHNQIHNEPYFFQNHNNDHIQPIIHSTH